MGGGEGGNLGSGGGAPGVIWKIIPPYNLCWNANVNSSGVAVSPVRYPRCWAPSFDAGGGIEGQLSPGPVRGKERGGHRLPSQEDHLRREGGRH